MLPTLSDLLHTQARRDFVGRGAELALLSGLLQPESPRVLHLHGITGIGKTALLETFTSKARQLGAVVVRIDCRNAEPTVAGFLKEAGTAIGQSCQDLPALIRRLETLGGALILVLDNYDVFRLMDTWLRQVLITAVPENVRVVFCGRQRPSPGWLTQPGWGVLMQALPLNALPHRDACEMLHRLGIDSEEAPRIALAAHCHPLALKLAASAHKMRPGLALEGTPIEYALDELTGLFLADVPDPTSRRLLEGVSVARRVTLSLLRALFPDSAPQDGFERLRELPFTELAADGLIIHDAVRDAIARSLRASDPRGYLGHQRTAWRQLLAESESVRGSALWRYTADMLYLVENPVVREAFFPSGTQQLAVEPATRTDEAAIRALLSLHDGPDATKHLYSWWRRLPQSFSVVRGAAGEVLGLCCKLRADKVEPGWLREDPVTSQWQEHLSQKPMGAGESALLCRRWLSKPEGELPCAVQAAVWLDLKRTYMELRPHLRRVYLTVRDLSAYAAVAQRLGFVVLEDRQVTLDDAVYQSAFLDFGSGSVDGWLAELAGAELGILPEALMLDPESHELILGGARIGLTPLEFGVLSYLLERKGRAISRADFLREVWGTHYQGGSNVVDAVVRTCRRKLGEEAPRLETVHGIGYRLNLLV